MPFCSRSCWNEAMVCSRNSRKGYQEGVETDQVDSATQAMEQTGKFAYMAGRVVNARSMMYSKDILRCGPNSVCLSSSMMRWMGWLSGWHQSQALFLKRECRLMARWHPDCSRKVFRAGHIPIVESVTRLGDQAYPQGAVRISRLFITSARLSRGSPMPMNTIMVTSENTGRLRHWLRMSVEVRLP